MCFSYSVVHINFEFSPPFYFYLQTVLLCASFLKNHPSSLGGGGEN